MMEEYCSLFSVAATKYSRLDIYKRKKVSLASRLEIPQVWPIKSFLLLSRSLGKNKRLCSLPL